MDQSTVLVPLLLCLTAAVIDATYDIRFKDEIQSSDGYEERRDNYSPVRYYEEKYEAGDGGEDDASVQTRGGSPLSSGLSQQQIKAILDHHNKLRAGEGASNMEVLKWNSHMATMGQQWADRCNFEHGQPQFNAATVGFDKLGQNIWAHTDPKKTPVDGVQAWFDEKSDYTYDTMKCRPGKACGHYTQVTWGKTREVGCGLTKCSSISGMNKANFLVCNYGPAGNWFGQKPFKKGAACTACDSGKFFCTDKLCDFSCQAAGGSKCKCVANCGKCGTKTNDCKCKCKPGWTGVACSEQCRDKDPKCGGNPGWPKFWCDKAHQFVLDSCPKMCKLCESPSGGNQCQRRSEDAPNSDDEVSQLTKIIDTLGRRLKERHENHDSTHQSKDHDGSHQSKDHEDHGGSTHQSKDHDGSHQSKDHEDHGGSTHQSKDHDGSHQSKDHEDHGGSHQSKDEDDSVARRRHWLEQADNPDSAPPPNRYAQDTDDVDSEDTYGRSSLTELIRKLKSELLDD